MASDEQTMASQGADQYDLVVKFLSNPKIFGMPDERKIDFLVKKGIDRAIIERALQGIKFCPVTKKAFCPNSAGEMQEIGRGGGVGFLGFIWRLIKFTSGLALGFAHLLLIKKYVWPRLLDYLGLKKPAIDNHNRLAFERRRTPPSDLHVNNEVLLKKLDSIVNTLQEVVTRQEAVSESLALLLKSRRSDAGLEDEAHGAVGQVVRQNSDRMLAEIADLKAMLVSPSRFPPMPAGTYIPNSAGSVGNNKGFAKPQVPKKPSSSLTSASQNLAEPSEPSSNNDSEKNGDETTTVRSESA